MKKVLSISDLKEREEKGEEVTPQHRLAIKNFERFRFNVLSGIEEEERFHQEYQRLQSMSKLSDHSEFLKEPYI